MPKKVTTVRMSQELADQVEAVARGRDVSVNTVVVNAFTEIQPVKRDKELKRGKVDETSMAALALTTL